ncbi:MAG: hypothetical protein DIU60_004200 [Actinomycetes bacterium]
MAVRPEDPPQRPVPGGHAAVDRRAAPRRVADPASLRLEVVADDRPAGRMGVGGVLGRRERVRGRDAGAEVAGLDES